MRLLREGRLDGRVVALAGVPARLSERLLELGAVTQEPPAVPDGLLFDARPSFGSGGQPGLSAALDGAWAAVSAQAQAMIERSAGAKLVLIAPAPGAGPLAAAARAGLENLARTLSVEWARHRITTCAVLPGASTSEAELAELVAYLLSPAGEYFSGCRFELGAVSPA